MSLTSCATIFNRSFDKDIEITTVSQQAKVYVGGRRVGTGETYYPADKRDCGKTIKASLGKKGSQCRDIDKIKCGFAHSFWLNFLAWGWVLIPPLIDFATGSTTKLTKHYYEMEC